ncbi:hypothetical protein CES86_0932 [Brucella lupini]|uniref:Uncharacterized protein n=2 Tax=Brucella/Ochrobactrum group TaxID=2826938 RepID=A0A256GWB8_9HYPH|nr:hypothetical protein CES86_0932 [Brucella lupini]
MNNIAAAPLVPAALRFEKTPFLIAIFLIADGCYSMLSL